MSLELLNANALPEAEGSTGEGGSMMGSPTPGPAPAAMAKRPERPMVYRSAPDLREGPELTGAKILVVEDSPLLAVNIEDALVDAGLQVVGIAASGAQALELAEKHRPELAIMDIRLAGPMDGVDVAVAIRERFGTWCVFASAHGAP